MALSQSLSENEWTEKSRGLVRPRHRSELGIKSEDAVLFGLLHVGLLVLAYTLLEEVSLSLERDHVHPLERVLNVVVLGDTKGEQKSVSHKLDVLAHKARVHSDELNGERVLNKLQLNLDSLSDDLSNALVRDLVVEVLVKEASEVSMHALITGDELVGESEAWHKSTFLKPENGAERTTEENAFNSGKGDKAL
jgi:hypothetical protein